MLINTPAMSNVERQRKFRASHPGYRNRFRHRPQAVLPAAIVAPEMITPTTATSLEPTNERPEPTEARREPTLFDPFPPFELKAEEKPIDLHLAGLAM